MKPTLDDVKVFEPGIDPADFEAMHQVFPQSHFVHLSQKKFRFYRTTFWYPLERVSDNIFESVICNLKTKANPSEKVIGVEWWFSVVLTNKTPQWLLGCHFDRDNIREKMIFGKVKHPEFSSVLFFNEVPYGELVVTDQTLTEKGIRPRQPKNMRFIEPKENLYAVFPGQLYHGVIGRMWRPISDTVLRISMAVNYWSEKPNVPYLRDSRDCMAAFQLDAGQKSAPV